MSKDGGHSYYRKPRDLLMWAQFDDIAGRMDLMGSSAITEAAKLFVETHKNYKRPPLPDPPDRRRPPGYVAPPDPFANHPNAPKH